MFAPHQHHHHDGSSENDLGDLSSTFVNDHFHPTDGDGEDVGVGVGINDGDEGGHEQLQPLDNPLVDDDHEPSPLHPHPHPHTHQSHHLHHGHPHVHHPHQHQHQHQHQHSIHNSEGHPNHPLHHSLQHDHRQLSLSEPQPLSQTQHIQHHHQISHHPQQHQHHEEVQHHQHHHNHHDDNLFAVDTQTHSVVDSLGSHSAVHHLDTPIDSSMQGVDPLPLSHTQPPPEMQQQPQQPQHQHQPQQPPSSSLGKGRKRRRYENDFKAQVLEHLKLPGSKLGTVSRIFNVPENTLREWTKVSVVQSIEAARTRQGGSLKANTFDPLHRLVEHLADFFDKNARQPENLKQAVTTKLIVAKALESRNNLLDMHESQPFLDPKEKTALQRFTGSDSWCKKFAKRHSLKLSGTRVKDLNEEDIQNYAAQLRQMASRVKQGGPSYDEAASLMRQAAEKLVATRHYLSMGYADEIHNSIISTKGTPFSSSQLDSL